MIKISKQTDSLLLTYVPDRFNSAGDLSTSFSAYLRRREGRGIINNFR